MHINEAGLRKQKCQNTNSEIKNKYYNYTDDDGNKVDGIDSFSNANDIIVNVKPYMVYNSSRISQATNTVTTRTYHDYEATAYTNIMSSEYNKQNSINDSAYIMGYRIPFKAGYQIDSLGRTSIDSKGDVTGDGERNVTDYLLSLIHI